MKNQSLVNEQLTILLNNFILINHCNLHKPEYIPDEVEEYVIKEGYNKLINKKLFTFDKFRSVIINYCLNLSVLPSSCVNDLVDLLNTTIKNKN